MIPPTCGGKNVRIPIVSFITNIKRTVRHIKMSANKMQIIDIYTQQRNWHARMFQAKLPFLAYQRYTACPDEIRKVRTKSTHWSKPSTFLIETNQSFPAIGGVWYLLIRLSDKINTEQIEIEFSLSSLDQLYTLTQTVSTTPRTNVSGNCWKRSQ